MAVYEFAGAYDAAVLDANSLLLKNTAFELVTEPGGVLTPLYTNRTRSAPVAQPFLSDAEGNVHLFADPGRYRLRQAGSPPGEEITVQPDPDETEGELEAHVIAPDPHPVYLTAAEGSAAFAPIGEPVAAAHIADPADAHDASAVSFVPTGTIAATDVQAAIVEAAAEAGAPGPPGPPGPSIYFNVMDYGALGDGATDDTAAINAATAAAEAAGGGTVFFPDPSSFYEVTNLDLADRVRMLGEGPGSFISQAAGTVGPILRNPTPAASIEAGGVQHLLLSAAGNALNEGLILLSGCKYFDVSLNVLEGHAASDFGVRFLGGPTPGDTQDNKFHHNLIRGLGAGAIAVDLVSSATAMPDGTLVTENSISVPAGVTVFKGRGHVALGFLGPSGCSFVSNIVFGADWIDWEGVDSFFAFNRFEALSNASIIIQPNSKSNTLGPNEYAITGGILTITDTALVPTQRIADMNELGGYQRRSKLSNLEVNRHLKGSGLPVTFDSPAPGAVITVVGNSVRGTITVAPTTPIPPFTPICRVLFTDAFEDGTPRCVAVWGQENHPSAVNPLSSNITANSFTLTSGVVVNGNITIGYMVIE